MQKVKEIVENLLKEDVRCRKSDTWLIIQTLRKLEFNIWINYKDLSKMPSFETITRSKRSIQHNENKYNDDEFYEEGITYESPGEEVN